MPWSVAAIATTPGTSRASTARRSDGVDPGPQAGCAIGGWSGGYRVPRSCVGDRPERGDGSGRCSPARHGGSAASSHGLVLPTRAGPSRSGPCSSGNSGCRSGCRFSGRGDAQLPACCAAPEANAAPHVATNRGRAAQLPPEIDRTASIQGQISYFAWLRSPGSTVCRAAAHPFVQCPLRAGLPDARSS